MPDKVTGEIVNYAEFEAKVKRALAVVGDLTPAFVSVASDWYRSNEQAFIVDDGPGQYEDLSETYKGQKIRRLGYAYPILKYSGRLQNSVVVANSGDSVREITPKSMILGTNVDYGIYHQSSGPREKMPYRPFLINKDLQGSHMHIYSAGIMRWNRIIETFVTRQIQRIYPGALKWH